MRYEVDVEAGLAGAGTGKSAKRACGRLEAVFGGEMATAKIQTVKGHRTGIVFSGKLCYILNQQIGTLQMNFLNFPYFSRLFKPHTVNCYVLSLVFALIGSLQGQLSVV